MKRLTLAAAVVTSLAVFAQGAPPPPPPKAAAPAPAPKAAPAPAPAPKAVPAPAPAAAAPAPAPKAAAAAPAPAAAGPDMSKMGPMARKPTAEAKTRKEIEAFIKAEDAIFAKKDWDALANRVDYPVYMITDSMNGTASSRPMDRAGYVAEMKPFWEGMPPGSATKHKLTISVLSDSLANVVDDYEMTMGKQKMKGRNAITVVRVGTEWKYKTMTEAGWGDMGAPPAAAPAPAPAAPAPAPAPAPVPAKNAPPPPPAKK